MGFRRSFYRCGVLKSIKDSSYGNRELNRSIRSTNLQSRHWTLEFQRVSVWVFSAKGVWKLGFPSIHAPGRCFASARTPDVENLTSCSAALREYRPEEKQGTSRRSQPFKTR